MLILYMPLQIVENADTDQLQAPPIVYLNHGLILATLCFVFTVVTFEPLALGNGRFFRALSFMFREMKDRKGFEVVAFLAIVSSWRCGLY